VRCLRTLVVACLLIGLCSVATAQDKQKFELKFEKDKAFYQKLTTKVEQTLKVQGGSDISLKHEQVFFFKWLPLTVDKDKVVLKQTIEGVIFKLDLSGQTVEFDSTNPNPPGGLANPGLADFFKNLIGGEFTVTLGKGLAVESVAGREEMVKKLGSVNPQIESLLKSILTDEAIKEMTDPSMGLTPPAEQAVNGTWTKKSTLSLGPIDSYDRTFSYTYKGKETGKTDIEKVELKAELVYKAPAAGQSGLPFVIKEGKLETAKDSKPGTILFNSKTGRVESVRMELKMTGELKVSINNMETTISLYQEQKSESDIADATLLPKK
jgi:hypothetical protein